MGRVETDAYKKGGHDKNFVPAKVVKEPVKALFEHKTDFAERKKNFRDENGEVATGPRNFLTNPLKHGQVGKNTTFGGVIPWMKEDYDVSKELAK